MTNLHFCSAWCSAAKGKKKTSLFFFFCCIIDFSRLERFLNRVCLILVSWNVFRLSIYLKIAYEYYLKIAISLLWIRDHGRSAGDY